MLWNDSHESWKDFALRCFNQSTNKAGISKEAAVDNFVAIHNGQGAQAKTGLHFNPASVTEANRMKANAASFFRHVEKEEFFDMLPYVLASMSDEYKLAFASQYLRPAGLTVSLIDAEAHDGLSMEVVCDTHSAAFDAMKAMSAAAMNPTPENLEIAERETNKATEKFARTRKFLTAARNGFKGAKAAIAKVCRKEPA